MPRLWVPAQRTAACSLASAPAVGAATGLPLRTARSYPVRPPALSAAAGSIQITVASGARRMLANVAPPQAGIEKAVEENFHFPSCRST